MDDLYGGISMDDIMNASGFDDGAQPAAPQGQQQTPPQTGYPQQDFQQPYQQPYQPPVYPQQDFQQQPYQQPDYQQPDYQQQYQQPNYPQPDYQQPYQQPDYQQSAFDTAPVMQNQDPSGWSVSSPGPINNYDAPQDAAPQYSADPYGAQPNYNGQPIYGNPPQIQINVNNAAPYSMLNTNYSMIKIILLSAITFGIYGMITYGHMTDDVNLVCSRYDGKKTMNYYLLIFVIAPITFGIASIVWMHNLCARIGAELNRRQVDYRFGASDFWLWGVLGSFILVGPFIFTHKLCTAINRMNEHYNQFG